MATTPTRTRISSDFGPRIIDGKQEFHHGIDFATLVGSPIYASRPVRVTNNSTQIAKADVTKEGVVTTRKGDIIGYGHYIEVEDIQTGHRYVMAHLESRPKVKIGQEIQPGELLGFTGNSGRSTGPHLHFETIINGIKVNPVLHQENTPVSFSKEPGSSVFTSLAVVAPNRANAKYPIPGAQQKPSNDSGNKSENESKPRPSDDPVGDFSKKKVEEAERRQKAREDARGQAGRTNRENTTTTGKRTLGDITGSAFHQGHDGQK